MLTIPPHVQTVLTQLKKNGHTAYIVGGSLRDLLRGKEPHDWDVTTSARPEQTLAAFEDFPTIPTGLQHGTVTVLIDHIPIEITTYRVDGTYTDARRPDSVTFTDRLSEDLARRDFTVNAIAYSPDGGLVDLYGGQDDLHAGILRAVGEPERRFTEDALRILRGFRFAAQLEFAIEPQTLAAMSTCREGLRKISAERIFSELSRLLTAPAAADALTAMVNTAVLPLILPRTASAKIWTAQSIDTAMATLPRELSVRLAWLFWGMPQDDIRADLNALKPPTRLKEEVLLLTERTTPPTDISAPAARRTVRHYGELTDAVLSLWQCTGHDVSALQAAADRVRTEGFCRTIADLPVSGNDLATEAGIPRGRALGEMLKFLLEHVTDHPEDAQRDILLDIARRKTQTLTEKPNKEESP